MALLGVNIDHVATVRQARREYDPDPVQAACVCQQAGADSIVAHLREDRRHISDSDVRRLKQSLDIRFNLEMSLAPDIVAFACKIRPAQVTLVPERRQELTTEGGLDVIKNFRRLRQACRRLQDHGIEVSLFIDPVRSQVDETLRLGVSTIELHTGRYAGARTARARQKELQTLRQLTQYARQAGLVVNAGHGLKYHNTRPVAMIPAMHELNIGHAIMARAIFIGLPAAVREMKELASS